MKTSCYCNHNEKLYSMCASAINKFVKDIMYALSSLALFDFAYTSFNNITLSGTYTHTQCVLKTQSSFSFEVDNIRVFCKVRPAKPGPQTPVYDSLGMTCTTVHELN